MLPDNAASGSSPDRPAFRGRCLFGPDQQHPSEKASEMLICESQDDAPSQADSGRWIYNTPAKRPCEPALNLDQITPPVEYDDESDIESDFEDEYDVDDTTDQLAVDDTLMVFENNDRARVQASNKYYTNQDVPTLLNDISHYGSVFQWCVQH